MGSSTYLIYSRLMHQVLVPTLELAVWKAACFLALHHTLRKTSGLAHCGSVTRPCFDEPPPPQSYFSQPLLDEVSTLRRPSSILGIWTAQSRWGQSSGMIPLASVITCPCFPRSHFIRNSQPPCRAPGYRRIARTLLGLGMLSAGIVGCIRSTFFDNFKVFLVARLPRQCVFGFLFTVRIFGTRWKPMLNLSY